MHPLSQFGLIATHSLGLSVEVRVLYVSSQLQGEYRLVKLDGQRFQVIDLPLGGRLAGAVAVQLAPAPDRSGCFEVRAGR